LGDHPQCLFGKIAVLGLDFFEDGDEACLIPIVVILYDFLNMLRIHDDSSSKNDSSENEAFLALYRNSSQCHTPPSGFG
jgi:hypothetical protein